MSRIVPIAMTMSMLMLLPAARAGAACPNDQTTLVLHAEPGAPAGCEIPDPCSPPGSVRTMVAVGTELSAYLLVRNYDDAAGVQTAFEWSPGWVLIDQRWDCAPGQITTVTPTGSGPEAGTLATSFDCVLGGQTLVLGTMRMMSNTGCVSMAESALPFGTHVVGCTGEATWIPWRNRGSICAGAEGHDACSPIWAPPPVTTCETGGPYAGAVGEPITFDGRGSMNCIDDHRWDFGDGAIGTGIVATHTYAAAATYTVTFCFSDSECDEHCCDTTADVEGATPVPDAGGAVGARLVLGQNRPNPFNPSSRIEFRLPATGDVLLAVFDAGGRTVRTLADGVLAAGAHHVEWDATDERGTAVASGVYLYRLEWNGRAVTRRMILIR